MESCVKTNTVPRLISRQPLATISDSSDAEVKQSLTPPRAERNAKPKSRTQLDTPHSPALRHLGHVEGTSSELGRSVVGIELTRLVANTGVDMEHLYVVIVSASNGNKGRIVANVLAKDLSTSMFGAFLFHNVFSVYSEETFDKFVAKADFAASEVDKVLREFGTYLCLMM